MKTIIELIQKTKILFKCLRLFYLILYLKANFIYLTQRLSCSQEAIAHLAVVIRIFELINKEWD